MADRKYAAGDTFPLREPLVREDGTTLHGIVLMRPKGRAIREAATAAEGWPQLMAMTRGVTGLTDRDLDEMDGEDLVDLIEVAPDFFGKKGSATATSSSGEASSPTAPQS